MFLSLPCRFRVEMVDFENLIICTYGYSTIGKKNDCVFALFFYFLKEPQETESVKTATVSKLLIYWRENDILKPAIRNRRATIFWCHQPAIKVSLCSSLPFKCLFYAPFDRCSVPGTFSSCLYCTPRVKSVCLESLDVTTCSLSFIPDQSDIW